MLPACARHPARTPLHPPSPLCAALAIYYSETTVKYGPLPAVPAPPGAAAPPPPPPMSPAVANAYRLAAEAAPACQETAQDLHHKAPVLLFVLVWAVLTASFQLCCPLEYRPAGWHVPWWAMPWLPSAGLFLVVFRWAQPGAPGWPRDAAELPAGEARQAGEASAALATSRPQPGCLH